MSLEKYVKSADYVQTCPICQNPLSRNLDPFYENHSQKGYECVYCSVPGVHTDSKRPFSQYNIGVMENVIIGEKTFPQIGVNETFFIHHKDKEWYNINNNLIKDQTSIVLTTPATREHITFALEEPAGLMWIGNLVTLPFIDTWNLSDLEGTHTKILTLLAFL